MSLAARFVGIITAPKATYQEVVAHPRWLGMLLLASVTAAVLIGGFMLTQVGQDAVYTQMQDRATGEGAAQQLAAMEKMLPYMGYFYMAGMLIGMPIFYLIISGVLWAIFNAVMGGDAAFKKVFVVVLHAAPVGILGQLFTMPLNYFRESLTSATNLSVLLPMLDEASFVAKFAGAIDLFLIWQLFVLAIGLAVLYGRRTQPIATSLFVVYGVIALIIAFVKAGS